MKTLLKTKSGEDVTIVNLPQVNAGDRIVIEGEVGHYRYDVESVGYHAGRGKPVRATAVVTNA